MLRPASLTAFVLLVLTAGPAAHATRQLREQQPADLGSVFQAIGSAIGQGGQLVQPLVDGTLQTANTTAQNVITGLQPANNGSNPNDQDPVLGGIQAGVASLTSALNNGLNAAGQIQANNRTDIAGSIAAALGAAVNTTRDVLGAAANASSDVAGNITDGLTAAAQAVNASLGGATADANQALSANATADAQGVLGITSALINTAGSIINNTAALGQQQQQPADASSDTGVAAGTGSGSDASTVTLPAVTLPAVTLPAVTSQSGPSGSDGSASSLTGSQAPADSPVVLTVGAPPVPLQSGAVSVAWSSVPMALAGVAALLVLAL